MKYFFYLFLLIAFFNRGFSQDKNKLPYYELSNSLKTFSSGNIVSRMIDGLGFRYYWATEGLTEKDLNFRPTKQSRSSLETIDHIYDLSNMILNCALKVKNTKSNAKSLSFKEKRKITLEILKKASDIFKSTNDISQNKIIFESKGKKQTFAFWNLLNGPLADAIWHTGQITSFRRSSGNPFPKGVNVFTGKVKRK